ncbi:MAG: PilZ domain-containing protein [Nitrospiraceae bacterium]
MLQRRCPRCRTTKLRFAPFQSKVDCLLETLALYPIRCQLCGYRFRAWLGRYCTSQRRNYERVRVRCPAWYRSERTPEPYQTEQGTVTNLSIRGCRIRTDRLLPIGTPVSLEFQPSQWTFPITIDCAIVRSHPRAGLGLRFVNLLRSEERRIRHLVDLHLYDAPL